MARAFPPPDFENWEVCRQLLPHAEKAIQYRPIKDESLEDWAFVLHNSSLFYFAQGKYTQAEIYGRLSWDAFETALGSEHLYTLRAMHNLAVIQLHQRRLQDAEKLHLQVLKSTKRILGPDNPHTLSSMACLASIYLEQKRLEEA